MANEPQISPKVKDQLAKARRRKLTWGAAGIAVEGTMTVEIDEAIETVLWNLSIEIPACCISIQIEGTERLEQLAEFLGRARPGHPLGASGEFHLPRSATTWAWDDETCGRMFLWLNRTGKHSMRAEFDRRQVDCILAALAEATRPV